MLSLFSFQNIFVSQNKFVQQQQQKRKEEEEKNDCSPGGVVEPDGQDDEESVFRDWSGRAYYFRS